MKVSIVIPNHNCYDYLTQCLNALENTVSGIEHEVIVMDSSDKDKERIKKYMEGWGENFTIYELDQNYSFAQKCNWGADNATGDYICFLNNDTIPQPGWLAAMVECAERRGNIIVGAKMFFPNSTRIQHIGGILRADLVPTHLFYGRDSKEPVVKSSLEGERSCTSVTGACMLIKATTFRELQGFNERFINGLEDVDLCFRAKLKGIKSIYCPNAFLYHQEHGSGQISQKIDESNWKVYDNLWSKRIVQVNVL